MGEGEGVENWRGKEDEVVTRRKHRVRKCRRRVRGLESAEKGKIYHGEEKSKCSEMW